MARKPAFAIAGEFAIQLDHYRMTGGRQDEAAVSGRKRQKAGSEDLIIMITSENRIAAWNLCVNQEVWSVDCSFTLGK